MAEPREPRYRFRPLGLRHAFAAHAWRYPGDYAMYDLALAPLLIAALLRWPLRALTGVSYYAVYAVASGDDPLVGVFSLTRRGGDVEIGVGLRPDLTGHGLGQSFLRAGLALARRRYRPRTFSLHVATFNRRAITIYERAGFRPGPIHQISFQGKRYDEMRMSRPAD